MSDNIQVVNSLDEILAYLRADDIGTHAGETLLAPSSKITLGDDGIDGGFVSKANPMPIAGNTSKDGSGTAYALLVDTNGRASVVVNSGSIAVTDIIPGTGAAKLGKAIDSAAGATDTGVAALAIRDDALSTLTPIEGDYVGLRVDATGALWVNVANELTLSLDELPDTATGDLAAIRAAVEAATPAGTNTIGSVKLTDGTNVATVRDVTAAKALNVAIVDGSGSQVTSFGGGTQYAVDAPLGSTPTGTLTLAIRDDALSTLTPIEGDAVGLRVDANGALWVGVSGSVAVTQSGTWNVVAAGDVASGLSDSGNPIKVGGVARTQNPTAVLTGQRVNAMFDKLGRLAVVPYHVRDLTTHNTTTITSTTEATVLAQGGASVFHDLVGVIVSNTDTTTPCRVDFKDSTSGTIRFSVYAPAGQTVGFMPAIPVTQATANNNWTATLSAAVNVRVFVQAIKNL